MRLIRLLFISVFLLFVVLVIRNNVKRLSTVIGSVYHQEQKVSVPFGDSTQKKQQSTHNQEKTLSGFAFPVYGKDLNAVISVFGEPRAGGSRRHQGIDIKARRGTPIIAVQDGEIIDVGDRGNAGKFIRLQNSNSTYTYFYAHLHDHQVIKSQQVRAGETIGTVGNTGNAQFTIPHLHFEIIRNKKSIDPLPILQKQLALLDY